MPSPRLRAAITVALALLLAAELYWIVYEVLVHEPPFLRAYGPHAQAINRALLALLLAITAAALARSAVRARRMERLESVPDNCRGLVRFVLALWATAAAVTLAIELPATSFQVSQQLASTALATVAGITFALRGVQIWGPCAPAQPLPP